MTFNEAPSTKRDGFKGPLPKLAMARTLQKVGRSRGDLGMARQGKALENEANADLATSSGASQPRPAPKASPSLSSPEPSASPTPNSPSDEQPSD